MKGYKDMLEKTIKKIEFDERENEINMHLNAAKLKRDKLAIEGLERMKDRIRLERELLKKMY